MHFAQIITVPYNLKIYRVQHFRLSKQEFFKDNVFCKELYLLSNGSFDEEYPAQANGGATIVTLLDTVRNRYYAGVAVCSVRDSFNRKRGVNIGITRAVQAFRKDMPVVMPSFANDCNHFMNRYDNMSYLAAHIPYQCYIFQEKS